MKIILAGCEYTGTTTMANRLHEWKKSVMGDGFPLIHDHFKLPHTSGHPDDTTLEEQDQVLALSPKLKEMYSRYSIYYHVHHYRGPDDLTVGLHIEESIYAQMYFGYGRPGEPFDRAGVSQQVEDRIKQITGDPVIVVHMTALPEVLARRMSELKDTPEHTNSPVREADIKSILNRFRDGVERSTLGPKIHIDTSAAAPDDSLAELVEALQPHLTDHDRARMEAHAS